MRFILAFVLSFISVFAIAQAPPMVLGGPQGINVTKALVTNWLSIPTYVDTPSSNPGPSPWPGKGYIIQVVKSGDTSVWQYTGQRWSKIAGASQETYTKLVTGGEVNQLGTSRQYTVSPSTYFINGVYYTLNTQATVTSATKTPNSNGRIDVIALSSTGAEIVQGTERPVPLKPSVGPNRLELAAIYYRAFDTIPREIGEGGLTSAFRILGRDSIYFTSGDSVISVKDSIGISRNDTAAMLNNYKFTAANGLTKDSTVFRLGGSLNQNTDINLNTRRLTIIGGSDTTRFFSNGRVSIGGTPDSTDMFRVNGNARINGDTRVNGILRLAPTSPSNAAVIINQNGGDGSLVWGGTNLNLSSNFGSRNVIINPSSTHNSVTGTQNTFIGRSAGNSLTSANNNTFIGNNAGGPITSGSNNTIIGAGDGHNYPNNTSNTIHLIAGAGYDRNRGDSVLLGLTSRYAIIGGGLGQGNYIRDYYLGGGHRVTRPDDTHVNLFAPSGWASIADTIGSNFTINAGRGTGAGTGGSVIFRTSPAIASGTTLQTLTERARITPGGNLLIGRTVDSIYILDVNGDGRFSGSITPTETANRRTFAPSLTGGQFYLWSRNDAGGFSGSNTGYYHYYGGSALTLNNSTNNVFIGESNTNLTGTTRCVLINGSASQNIQRSIGINGSVTHDRQTNLGGNVSGIGAVALSHSAKATASNGVNKIAVAITGVAEDNEFVVGGTSGGITGRGTIDNVYFGSGKIPQDPDGVRTQSGSSYTINGSGAFGTSLNGGNITIAGGKGTGNGTPGAVIFSTSTRLPNTADTSTLQTLTERARISERGNLLVGTSTDDTSSLVNIVSTTKGFLQPRMTNTQRDAITTPATGLQLFSTTDSANYVYRGTGGGWQKMANEISGSATLDFPSTGHGTSSDIAFTVTGAELGDVVSIGIPHDAMSANISYTAWVSAANQVTIRLDHYASSGNVDPVSATFKVKVFK